MKRPLNTVPRIFLSLHLIFITSCFAATPENLGLSKSSIKNYYSSGLYIQEVQKEITEAEHYILTQANLYQKNKQNKLAVILDIDETSLSNYKQIVEDDFANNQQKIHQEILAAQGQAIKPTLALYHSLLKHHINVFFVTGRRQSERQATESNLIKAGYQHWAGLYLRPKHYTKSSIIPFKSSTRALIAQKGYIIIATIGDQYSDLKGGYAQKGFKVPNPFYYIP